MSDSVMIREYLVALGFKVDQVASKKFEGGLESLDKRAFLLGKTVLGVAAAAQAMVSVFAFQMEKLYYASKRAQSTAGNLQAVAFGADQIGVGGDKMKSAIIGMAATIRANPGLTGLLNSLGVQVKGRDMSDVALDLVTQLKKMPPYIAQQYAQMFGIDPDTLFMLSEGLSDLKRAADLRKQMAKEAGIDTEKAAEAGKEYANQLRMIGARLDTLKDIFAIKLLPGFSAFTKALDDNLLSLIRYIGKFETLGQVVDDLMNPKSKAQEKPKNFVEFMTRPLYSAKPGGPSAGPALTTPSAEKAKSGWDAAGDIYLRASRWLIPDWARRPEHRNEAHSGVKGHGAPKPAAGLPAAPAASAAPKGPYETPGALFERLEQQYALPPGLLFKVWKMESAMGRKMLSPAGAKGHFGFMDKTAKQYGVDDPNDLTQSATGSAKMWSERLKARGGDLRKAAADYNWGQGNVDQYGLGRAPAETRDYMDKIGALQQSTTISISGVSDPKAAAAEVEKAQRQVNADLVRNLKPKVQ